MKRPLGLTILCILEFIGGIFSIASGIALFSLSPLMSAGDLLGIMGALGFLIGIVLIVLGIVSLFITWGLWNMHKWAWTIALILQIVGAIINVVSGGWTGLILNVIIAGYLWYIKDVFH